MEDGQKNSSLPCPQKTFDVLLNCYTQIRNGTAPINETNKDIGRDEKVNMAAYWIGVTDLDTVCRKRLSEANPDVDIVIKDLKLNRAWLERIPQNWTKRHKKLFSGDSWIEYQRYVDLGSENDIKMEVMIGLSPKLWKHLKLARRCEEACHAEDVTLLQKEKPHRRNDEALCLCNAVIDYSITPIRRAKTPPYLLAPMSKLF